MSTLCHPARLLSAVLLVSLGCGNAPVGANFAGAITCTKSAQCEPGLVCLDGMCTLLPGADVGVSPSDGGAVGDQLDSPPSDQLGGEQDLQGEGAGTADANCSCGDGACVASCGENGTTCPADCTGCGDGTCSPGESVKTCAVDCCGGGKGKAACGDGVCVGYECGETPETCPADCGKPCGNKICEKGETPNNCADDCKVGVCGNHQCEPTDLGPQQCPEDCANACGDCVCDKGENPTNCPADCGSCGDGVCSPCANKAETGLSCPQDCNSCKQSKDGSACDIDNDPCTQDSCSGGACAAGPKNTCSDGNPCTTDECQPKSGCLASVANTAPCDDGNLCTSGDACDAKVCTPGAAKSCNDGLACTDDGCEQGTGECTHKSNSSTCDDKNACTVNDQCSGGSCFAGTKANCDDQKPCTSDSCDPAVGCQHAPIAGPCDDGDPCSQGDACVGDQCAAGPSATACPDDGNPCTAEACVPAAGCKSTGLSATACSDNNACTDGDICQKGTCVTTGVKNCEDSLVCTDNICDPAKGCLAPKFNTSPCEDGSKCTVGDACQNGSCTSGVLTNCQAGGPCQTSVCNAATGQCDVANKVGSCSDSDPCTQTDTCSNGKCVGSNPTICAQKLCTSAVCTPGQGCLYQPAPGACNDGDSCTNGDFCSNGSCTGNPLTCNPPDACHTAACAAGVGCKTSTKPDGTSCGSGMACLAGVCATACASNYCQDNNKSSGSYCSSLNKVTCSTSGGCKVATQTACPSDACNNATCSGSTCGKSPKPTKYAYSTSKACGGNYCIQITNVTATSVSYTVSKANGTAFSSWSVQYKLFVGSTVVDTPYECGPLTGKLSMSGTFPTSKLGIVCGGSAAVSAGFYTSNDGACTGAKDVTGSVAVGIVAQ